MASAAKCNLEFLRVRDIVRPHGIAPISRAAFYQAVRDGRVPPGTALGARMRVWKRSDILAVFEGNR